MPCPPSSAVGVFFRPSNNIFLKSSCPFNAFDLSAEEVDDDDAAAEAELDVSTATAAAAGFAPIELMFVGTANRFLAPFFGGRGLKSDGLLIG